MGKSKVGVEELCRQFYDSMVFNPIIELAESTYQFL